MTNVTNFGAFVDIGVHQDGRGHVSALADKFVKDPREVVKAGDVVKVLEVDLKHKRVGLSMRLTDEARRSGGDRPGQQRPAREAPMHKKPKPAREQTRQKGGTAMSAAFAKLHS